jgi:hypothetical protein
MAVALRDEMAGYRKYVDEITDRFVMKDDLLYFSADQDHDSRDEVILLRRGEIIDPDQVSFTQLEEEFKWVDSWKIREYDTVLFMGISFNNEDPTLISYRVERSESSSGFELSPLCLRWALVTFTLN